MTWLVALLALGSTARLTRLGATDDITFRLREWLSFWGGVKEPEYRRRARLASWLYRLISCPWCLSAWVAPPVVAAAWLWGDRWFFVVPALALTVSYAVGYLASREGDDDAV
jgi:hypothetical protein